MTLEAGLILSIIGIWLIGLYMLKEIFRINKEKP